AIAQSECHVSRSGDLLKWRIQTPPRTTPMTTNADDVWRLLAELIEAQKETERVIKEESQETDRRFREQSEESDRRFEETRQLLQRQSEESDSRSETLGERRSETLGERRSEMPCDQFKPRSQ
ncbi:MAG: hypothetical protein P5684_24915, partial [Limnospira sp. PMC 1238.20]|nr:hypothetical protein [Limnospira sp. PMC 1238.20]MDT9241759.1 hypothetical protein [Limnospira sp. PMC 1261.20]MDT9272623.1 hypothetical protein [Limnospira sp. PMC 1234.20]